MATLLVAGVNLSANATVIDQQNLGPSTSAAGQSDRAPAPRSGSPVLSGIQVPMPANGGRPGKLVNMGMEGNAGTPFVTVPTPAQIFPIERPPALPVADDAPSATVPEPGTLATLAAGLVLMGAFARRRTGRGQTTGI
jgi:hypothetical protein